MNLKLYIVVNQEGKYFRAKGRNGYGETWVDDAQKAKIYSRIGSARGIVSYFASEYPSYGMPEIHELNISSTTVLNETKRVEKFIKKKAEAKIRQEQQWAQYRLAQAERDVEKAQQVLEEQRKKWPNEFKK